MFDSFDIWSHGHNFSHDVDSKSDYLFTNPYDFTGTSVDMRISKNFKLDAADIFKEFSDFDGTPTFNKTIVPISLADYVGDGSLVSRSQAKRVLTGFEKFTVIVLNFSQIKRIGQAFADEIFRVYTNSNPDKEISYINANTEVDSMIQRALKNTGTR